MISARTLASVGLIVVGGIAGASCAEPCSLAGCASTLTITVADFVAEDRFDVVIDADTASGGFGCARGDDGFEVVDATGDFAGDDRVLAPECRDTGVVLNGTAQPATLTVTITNGDDTRAGTFTDIDYEEIVPNGPDCEPTCSFTTLEVE